MTRQHPNTSTPQHKLQKEKNGASEKNIPRI